MRSRSVLAVLATLSLLVGLGGGDIATAADATPPPLPPVLSATELGLVQQNPVIFARDNATSAPFHGKSVWIFDDTPMSVSNETGSSWNDNTLSWTGDLNAADGISLDHDYVDSSGNPAEFMPYTKQEQQYNDSHDPAHCTASPCGAHIDMWPGAVVNDPARDRLLVFYGELWRAPNYPSWKTLGSGIAVIRSDLSVIRPIARPGAPAPTLLWGPNETGLNGGAVIEGSYLYAYGCVGGFLVINCQVGRAPTAKATLRSSWTYYDGTGWTTNRADAVTVFQGGAAGNTVFYNAYLGQYMTIYSGLFSNDVFYRVSDTPWGPWSDQGLAFHGTPPTDGSVDYAAQPHPEFQEGNGRTQYVTYVHGTGLLRQDLPLVKVVFGQPAG